MAASRPDLVALRGDETELYERYAERLRRIVARNVTGSRAHVDDACAHAWEKLLTNQPDRETVFGWLCKTAIREGWRLAQRDLRDVAIDSYAPRARENLAGAAPVDVELAVDARAALRAVASLPDRQRMAFALKVGGRDYGDIARDTGHTYTWVNRQLTRARAAMRETQLAA